MWSLNIDLLCLPWAGASAMAYARWQRRMPHWIRVVPIELSGRGGRLGEPFVEDFDRSVTELCDEHEQVMQRPYALFGHSMGALLAHGMAQLQRERGRPLPRVLFASGSPAPSHGMRSGIGDRDDEALIAELRKQKGTPEAVFGNAELLRMALDTLRADYRTCESFRYRAREALPTPIHAFGGREDDFTTSQLEAWRLEAGGAFTLHWFEGGHFFIRQQEEQVLSTLVRMLAHEAASRSGLAAMA